MTGKIAWAGELVLLEAKWTDRDGHLVKFKIAAPNEERPNPFKAYTKRRSGKAGTIFGSACAHIGGVKTDETVYSGQLMLAGWADTSTKGYTVTFWCEPPDQGMHPFEGFQRGKDAFMCMLVELDEDNAVIDQGKRERVENAARPSAPRRQKLAQLAGMFCSNPVFHRWINEVGRSNTQPAVYDQEGAAGWMREALGIDSRRQLDEMEEKARMFHEKIRQPFVDWQQEQGIGERRH